MTIAQRLIQAQEQEQQIADQIAAYEAEIQRLAPQLWATRGKVALLIDMVNEETRIARDALPTPPAGPDHRGAGEPPHSLA